MSKKPNINRLIELQQLLLKFSQIDRVVDRKHGQNYRRENDTEHSYNLAMTALFLAPHFPGLDQNLLLQFALVHDLVEVHAGDTYVFADEATLAAKAEREHQAQQQLAREWPDFPRLNELIAAYEQHQSKEAAFIYALDKIMPIMQIYINDGYTWQQEGLSLEKLHRHKQPKVAGSAEITEYYQQLYDLLTQSRHLIRPV